MEDSSESGKEKTANVGSGRSCSTPQQGSSPGGGTVNIIIKYFFINSSHLQVQVSIFALQR